MLVIENTSDTVIREVMLNGLAKTPLFQAHAEGIELFTDLPWKKEKRSKGGSEWNDTVVKGPIHAINIAIGISYPLAEGQDESELIEFPDQYPLDLFPPMAFTLFALRDANLHLFDLLAGHLLPQTKLSITFVQPNEVRFEIAIGTFRSLVAYPYNAYLAEEADEDTVWNLNDFFTPVA